MAEAGMCDCCSERYLEDAKKANHAKCAEVLEKIMADEKKHLSMLKDLCKEGIC